VQCGRCTGTATVSADRFWQAVASSEGQVTDLLVERTRTHYARSYGDPLIVRVDESIGIDLELPASYARDLLADMQRALATGETFASAQIAVDLPVRIFLGPLQAEQFVEKLEAVMK
jgi:hypothetical protein